MTEVQQLMKRVVAHKKAAARKKEAAIIQVRCKLHWACLAGMPVNMLCTVSMRL